MAARGPDASCLWVDTSERIGLAHRRLAIQDLSDRGTQPMWSADRSVCVVFNGEIYNHPDLRKACEARGARYVSDSDTETLLHLYALEGPSFVRMLRGMFAFALWDARDNTLHLARDPFGIKPLYYARADGQFMFASQVKSILAAGVSKAVDPAGVASFLTWGYVTEPFTWYGQIRAVKAGSLLTVQADGRMHEQTYCDPMNALRQPVAQVETSSLRDALLDSVRHHLLSDVPLGIFLSAGVDSGTLLSLIREADPATAMHSVTVGFDEFRGTLDDEVPDAAGTARRFGTEHTSVTYSDRDFLALHDDVMRSMDQPTVDGVNTYFVSKAAAATGLKVAFSGVGGDELFGGYPSFSQVPRLAHALSRVPPALGRRIRTVMSPILGSFTSAKYASTLEYGGSVEGAYLLRRALFMPWELPAIVGEDFAAEGLEALDLLGSLRSATRGIRTAYFKVMALEHNVYLRNCLLRDADWAGMAHSLEIRTPLVDSVLFAQTAAQSIRSRPLTKEDFSHCPHTPLLTAERSRKKTGFNIPFRQWVSAHFGSTERGQRGWARHVMRSHGFEPLTPPSRTPVFQNSVSP